MQLALFYQYYWPDDIVSARHFQDLAEGLAAKSWAVTMYTSNGSRRSPGRISRSASSCHNRVQIIRLKQLSLSAKGVLWRALNSLFVLVKFGFRIATKRFDAIVVGTDPQLSQLVLPFLRWTHPKAVLGMWSFDVYPEAIIASGRTGLIQVISRAMKAVTKICYDRLDIMADIGPCMRQLLSRYDISALQVTLTPWSLVEPRMPVAIPESYRKHRFGNANRVCLYSGTLGEAHDWKSLLSVAQGITVDKTDTVVDFSVVGARVEALRAAIDPTSANIRISERVAEADLHYHLGSADVHLISLNDGWQGIVVPSKFFGSLAIGRPVVFVGPEESSISRWIAEYRVGISIRPDALNAGVLKIRELLEDDRTLREMRSRAQRTYQSNFSRQVVLNRWDRLLVVAVGQKIRIRRNPDGATNRTSLHTKANSP